MHQIIESLSLLGLSSNESTIYLALLRIGDGTAPEIARAATIPRTYAYDLLKSLETQGLVTSRIKDKKIHFSPLHPQRLKTLITRRERAFSEILPELEDLYKGTDKQATVRFYEGKEGIAAIHQESLEEAKSIDVFGEDQEWMNTFPDWEKHVRTVVRNKIQVREIATRLPQTTKYSQLYTEGVQEMRFTRPHWKFHSNVLMWDNKTVFLSYAGEMHGVIIESQPITATLRAAFEVLWEQAEKK
jgi:sugar-specific transcriptional regulator TrmB